MKVFKFMDNVEENDNKADFECRGEWTHTQDGSEFDCDYEYSGEVTCDECKLNGGDYDPRYPRDIELDFCEKLFDIDDNLKQLQLMVSELTDVEVEYFDIEAEFEFTTVAIQTIRGWINKVFDGKVSCSEREGNESNDVSN